jgi:ribosomal protein S25
MRVPIKARFKTPVENIVESSLSDSKDFEKVRNFLVEKSAVRQSTIGSALKITPSRLNDILSALETNGVVQKRKELHKGHQINTIVVIKDHADAYPAAAIKVQPESKGETKPIAGNAFFSSPCFFCKQLETCEPSFNGLNYINCTKLHDWIATPLNS